MAASTSTSYDLDRTGILRNAFQKLGVVPAGQDPSDEYLAMGSDALNVVIKSWENKGVFLARMERTTQLLSTGVTQSNGTKLFTTDSDTLDIHIRHPYVTDTSGIDTKVTVVSRGRYMEITDKDDTGQPTLMMVEKTDRVRFTLYPVPDSNFVSITYPRTRLLTDMDAADNTTGLPTKYLKALIIETALELCPHFGFLPKMAMLREELNIAISEATNDDTERGPLRMVPYYGIGWRRY